MSIFDAKNNMIINIGNLKVVSVKLPDGTFEQRELKHLGSQMKQSITSNINKSIKTLAKLKAKGIQQPGALKFKSQLTTIELKQCGGTNRISGTHRIDRKLNKVFIQGLQLILYLHKIILYIILN